MMAVRSVQFAQRSETSPQTPHSAEDSFGGALERVLNEANDNPEGPQPKKFDLDEPRREDDHRTRDGKEQPEAPNQAVQQVTADPLAAAIIFDAVDVAPTGTGIDATTGDAAGVTADESSSAAVLDAERQDLGVAANSDGDGLQALIDAIAAPVEPLKFDAPGVTTTGPTTAGPALSTVSAQPVVAEPVATQPVAAEPVVAGTGSPEGSATELLQAAPVVDESEPPTTEPQAKKFDVVPAKVPTATDLLTPAAASLSSTQLRSETATAAGAPTGMNVPNGFDMSKLGEGIASRLRTTDKVQSLSLELHPAELGSVRVDVRQIDGVTHLSLTPDRLVGGHRLAAAMADLRHDLERAGVNIGDLQLRQDTNGSQRGNAGGGSEHQSDTGEVTRHVSAPASVGVEGSQRTGRLSDQAQRLAIDL